MSRDQGIEALLFTDIEGSSRRWEEDPAAMSAALARHDDLVRAAIARHGGRVFKAGGDSFFAVFDSPASAIAAAVVAQCALLAEPERALLVRMAVHAGVVERRGGDLFGPPLNVCARLLAAAHGGQVLVSGTAVDLVPGPLPVDVELRDLGEHRLRDVARPVRVWQAAAPGLPDDLPPPASLAPRRDNLPAQTTSFIGREAELARVAELLRTTRLLTLAGIGGVGKTRIAIEAASAAAPDYEDGVWFVDLAPVDDPSLVLSTVSAVMGVCEERCRDVRRALLDRVADRRLLLVLDNCEQVLGACAVLADELLRHASGVRVLATSRTRLGIAGETVYTIQGMALPEPCDDGAGMATLLSGEAARLFVERARAVRPDLSPGPREAAALYGICRALDGLPLAIELAAARTSVLSVPQIADRIDERFRLLVGGSRTASARQRTLRAAMDWSWDLLEAREAALLCRLAVFAGGWSLESAEEVCADDDGLVPRRDVLDVLSSLVAQSLVVVEEADEPRYRLLETVRQYADERAGEGAGRVDPEELRDRHAACFLELARRAEPELTGPDQVRWLDRLEADIDNFRAALARFRDTARPVPGLMLAGHLLWFWLKRTCIFEPRAHLASLLAMPGATDDKAALVKALYADGVLARHQDDYEGARASCGAALATAREIGDPKTAAAALNALAIVAQRHDGDSAAARALLEESLVLRRELGDLRGEAVALHNLAAIASDHDNDLRRARDLLTECLAIMERIGDISGVAGARRGLGQVAQMQGDLASAREMFEASLAAARELGVRSLVADALALLGGVALDDCDLDAARASFAESREAAARVDSRWFLTRAIAGLGEASRRAGDLADAAAHLERGLELAWALDEKESLGTILGSLGRVRLVQGDTAVAGELLHRSLETRDAEGELQEIAAGLEGLAILASAEGDHRRALVLGGAADGLRAAKGAPRPAPEAVELDAWLGRSREALGDEAAACLAAGAALSRSEAVAYGRGDGAAGSGGPGSTA